MEIDISEDVLPPQRQTVQKQIINLEEYSFLRRELQLIVDAGPGCGGVAWPAALVLSKYLAYLHGELALSTWTCKSIIELGAGTGIVSLALASLAPDMRILATDIDALLPLMRENVSLNGFDQQVDCMKLDWNHPPHGQYDVILAADCVYNEAAFVPLVKTLKSLSTRNSVILFCYKKRRKADKRFFVELKRHFNLLQVDDDPDRGMYNRESIFLYRLQLK